MGNDGKRSVNDVNCLFFFWGGGLVRLFMFWVFVDVLFMENCGLL